jgi:hypothetical protein
MARSAQTDISISFILIETLYVYLWLGPWNFRIHFKQNFLIDQLIFFPLDPKYAHCERPFAPKFCNVYNIVRLNLNGARTK